MMENSSYPTEQTHASVRSLYSEGNEPSRYNRKKSFIFQALKDLAIDRLRGADGVTAYITHADVEVLDKYVDIRKQDGKVAAEAFAKKHRAREETAIAHLSTTQSTEHSSAIGFPEMMKLFDRMIASQMLGPTDVLSPQRQLKEAVAESWVLSTAQVRGILGVRSWSGSDRYGFKFERAGKVGAQAGWRVVPAPHHSGAPE